MNVRKSFSIFAVIVIITVACILAASIDSSSIEMLKNADPCYLILAFGLTAAGWVFDTLKFMALAKASGERLSFRFALSVIWINYFGCAITPMQSGGGPFQIYLLYTKGISVGKSIAITTVRTLEVLVLLALVLPVAALCDPALLAKYSYIKYYAFYILIFVSLALFVLVVSVVRPQWLKHWVNLIFMLLKRIGIVKQNYLLKPLRWINKEIDAYNVNMKVFTTTGKKWLILSFLIAIVHETVYLSIMPCMIKAAGFNVDYFRCLIAESLLIFMLYFVPTPGGSGVAEGGAAAVIALFVPWNVAGIVGVSWRIVSEYTGVALGAGIILKTLGWKNADKIMSSQNGRVGENADRRDSEAGSACDESKQ
ncbi:MAG: lysylphosphatidylglycerol synthase transmembrane domain-containing protein [Synergistes sp.]|nr:lysylphosphatidylglycerol synthase transmembrane domain-containing protein [Synergistes sp.]